MIIKYIRALLGFDKKLNKKENTNSSFTDSYSSEFNDNYLFDFKNYASQYNDNMGAGIMIGPVKVSDQPTKIKIKPIDVLIELETIPTPFALTLLKISGI